MTPGKAVEIRRTSDSPPRWGVFVDGELLKVHWAYWLAEQHKRVVERGRAA